jgi:hypothetical protein
MGQHTGYRRGQHTNGQNTRFYKTSSAARKVLGQRRAPAVVRPPDHSKDTRNPFWAREAAAKVLQDKEWLDLAESKENPSINIPGYDPTCGMKSKKEFSLELMLSVFGELAEVEAECYPDGIGRVGLRRRLFDYGLPSAFHIYLASVGVHRLTSKTNSYTNIDMGWHATVVYDYYARLRYPAKFTVDAPQPSTAPHSEEQEAQPTQLPVMPKKVEPPKPTIKKAPLKEPEKSNGKHPTLTLGHQRILEQIGGDTEVPCPDCGIDLSPRFKLAREQGTCPSVFVYAKDNLAYCGPCYGKLPYYPDPALSKSVVKPVNKPVPQMKLKPEYSRSKTNERTEPSQRNTVPGIGKVESFQQQRRDTVPPVQQHQNTHLRHR